MLLDQGALNVIEQKLINKCSLFNIQVLLQTLQLITRPLNYPDYEKAIDDTFYLDRITQKLNEAKASSNKQQRYLYLFEVLSRLVFCCYYIDSIREELQEDKELRSALEKAVEGRIYTSDEEQCAEKTLLITVINKPQEIMSICSEFQQTLNYAPIKQEIVQRIAFLEKIYKEDPDKDDLHKKDPKAPKDVEIQSRIKLFNEVRTTKLFNEAKTAAASERLNDLGCTLRGYQNSFFRSKNDNQTSLSIKEHSHVKMPMDTARLEFPNLITIKSSDSLIVLESSDSIIIDEYFSDDTSSDDTSSDENSSDENSSDENSSDENSSDELLLPLNDL